ncbi:hypothetical protein [Paenibacillus sp. GCM10023250]|uniref:hypothetical protein n=1 Tax=Paenibacillus sp. GCM10023250 TaxID=3252648 RepID=UPI00361A4D9F
MVWQPDICNMIWLGCSIDSENIIGGWKSSMKESLIEKELYALPFYQQAKPKWSFHLLFLLSIFMLLGAVLIPGAGLEKIILNVIWVMAAIFFGYVWLSVAFFRKPFLKMTEDSLEYSRKAFRWNSIHNVEVISGRAGSKQLVIRGNEQGKRSFWRELDRFILENYSVGDYKFTILGSIFSNIDLERLALTIVEQVKVNKT